MQKAIVGLLCCLLAGLGFAQVPLQVEVPFYYTPLNGSLYIAGDFNNWDPAGQALTQNPDGTWSTTLNVTPGSPIEYKFTRGSWPRVESQANGGFLPNRAVTPTAGQTLVDTVAAWEDLAGPHTVVGNTHILDMDFGMPQFNAQRRVWIYLPQDYYTSNQSYPVLYMHDAQNLFDAIFSFAGEWQIDEGMEGIQNSGGLAAIVVGIDNGGASRIDEYCTWNNPQYGGGAGEQYLDFLVNTLKPYIDTQFRTRPGRETTGIMGSSLGGLISHYAALERPDVFGKAGIFSPSYWFSDSVYQHTAQQGHSLPMRIYMMAGEQESASMVPDLYRMRDTLLSHGFSNSELNVLTHTDGQHSEWYWAREFPAAFNWLFADVLLSLPELETSNWKLIFRSGQYEVQGPEGRKAQLTLTDMQGKQYLKIPVVNGQLLGANKWARGIYIATLRANGHATRQKIYLY